MRHLCHSSQRWPPARGSQIKGAGVWAGKHSHSSALSCFEGRCPGWIALDPLEPRAQCVKNSCRDELTEAHGRQSREELHPFSGSLWKERQLTRGRLRRCPARRCPWIIPDLSTALGEVVLFPGEHRGPGTPRDSPKVMLLEGEVWELNDFGIQPLLSSPWRTGCGSPLSSQGGSHPVQA